MKRGLPQRHVSSCIFNMCVLIDAGDEEGLLHAASGWSVRLRLIPVIRLREATVQYFQYGGALWHRARNFPLPYGQP
jgi:hypothetical protein